MIKQVRTFSLILVIALLLVLSVFSYRYSVEAQATYTPTFTSPQSKQTGLLGNQYAKLKDDAVIYTELDPSAEGFLLDEGYQYASWIDTVDADGITWYQINEEQYVKEDELLFAEPSVFEGVIVNKSPARPFGWVLTNRTKLSPCAGCTPSAKRDQLSRYDFVQIFATEVSEDGTIWHNIGENQWLDQARLGLVPLIERPFGVSAEEQWVSIDLYQQTVTAYQGDQMLYASLISAGEADWPTREGTFSVWKKHEQTTMSGWYHTPDYYRIEDVPHSLFFDNSIALHGAYWHDRFGYPNSHGCVNLAPKDAEWIYNWAIENPDLTVHVHSSVPETWDDETSVVTENEQLFERLSTSPSIRGFSQ